MNRERRSAVNSQVTLAWVALVVAWLVLGPVVGGIPLWVLLAGLAALLVLRESLNARARRPGAGRLETQPGTLVLGQDAQSGEAVTLSDQQLCAHGVILGATGAGKTTTLLTILEAQIARGRPVVALDLKGSNSFGQQLSDAARAAQRPFNYWTFNGPMSWNPLQYGDPTELKDKLISTERFTEPHYQRAAERYLQTALQVLNKARPDRPVTLQAVVNLLDPTRLQEMLKYVPRDMAQHVGPYLASLGRDQQSAISGLQSRFAVMADSEPGQWLQPRDGRPQLDLKRALCGGGEIVLFSLNSSRYGKLAAQIAAMIIQDVVAIAGYRQGMPHQPLALIAIDEFSALEADNILALLARAREAGISVLLSTQEMADLDRLASGFKDQALGIVATVIAHRQSVPDSAEFIARMIGTQTVPQYTHQLGRPPMGIDILLRSLGRRSGEWKTGMGTVKDVEEFRIHPNLIKELRTGQAVLITKNPTAQARIVQVVPKSRRGATSNGHH
jgi:conjugal transfer pilus assembly protein TraD